MHFSTPLLTTLALLLTPSLASDAAPAAPHQARATTDIASLASKCSSSYSSVFTSARPTPKDKSLSSWLSDHQATTTFAVPSSLTSAYCSYDQTRASWVRSDVVPYVSSCSPLFAQTDSAAFNYLVSQYSSTATWCYSATHNAAPARETGYLRAEVLAAAGLVAAVL